MVAVYVPVVLPFVKWNLYQKPSCSLQCPTATPLIKEGVRQVESGSVGVPR